jgi:hypothetical protein
MQDTIVSTANISTSANTPQANSFATSSTPLQVTPSPLHEITVDVAGIKVAISQGAEGVTCGASWRLPARCNGLSVYHGTIERFSVMPLRKSFAMSCA